MLTYLNYGPHKHSLLIMCLQIFEIKLWLQNLPVDASLSEIWFVVPHGFISQKLKKLWEAESLQFCPTDTAFFLYYYSALYTAVGKGDLLSLF